MPRLSIGLEQVFTNLGIVGAGYKLYFFETGTTTPKTTYSDEDLTIANTNPIILNAAGRPDVGIWGSDPSIYRMVLGTPESTISDVLLDPVVNVDPVDNYSINNIAGLTPIPTAYWGTTTGTSTNYVLNPALVDITSYSNQQTFFIDFHVACSAAPDININGLGALDLVKKTGLGTTTSLVEGDIKPGRYECSNNGVAIEILNPQIPYLTSTNFSRATNISVGVSYLNFTPIIAINSFDDSNNDMNFIQGIMTFSDGSGQSILESNLTKKLDQTWSAGNNQGGLDTGTKQPNTDYYCFAIYNPTSKTTDALFSRSFTSPTLPSGYTKKYYICCFLTDGSANIRKGIFFYNKDGSYDFRLYEPIDTGVTSVTNVMQSINLPIPSRIYLNAFLSASATYNFTTNTSTFIKFTSANLNTTPYNYNSQLTAGRGLDSFVYQQCSEFSLFIVPGTDGLIYAQGTNSTSPSVKLGLLGWHDYVSQI